MKRLQRIAALIALVCVAVLMIGVGYEVLAERLDASRYPPPGKMIDVGAYRLHLRCEGNAPGPTVVMVAGGGTPAIVSHALQSRIAKFARVCSYDRPGLGWSDEGPPPTFGAQVADLENLLRVAKVPGPYVFAPESYGALIVIAFADKHPEQVAGVVFLDGAEPRLWFEAVKEQAGIRADVRDMLMQAAWRTGVVRLIFPLLEPAWVQSLPASDHNELRAIYSRPSPGYAEAIEAYRRTPPRDRPALTPGALGGRCVIAVEHGALTDQLSPAFQAGWADGQARLARLSRAGSVMVLKNASHEIAQERPDETAMAVKECWQRARRP